MKIPGGVSVTQGKLNSLSDSIAIAWCNIQKGSWDIEPIWPLAAPEHILIHTRLSVQCCIAQQPFNSPVIDSEHWGDKDLDKRAHARTHSERWRKKGLQVPNGTWVALISCLCSWTSNFTHRCSVMHHISQLLCMCDVSGVCSVSGISGMCVCARVSIWYAMQYMYDSVVWYGMCMACVCVCLYVCICVCVCWGRLGWWWLNPWLQD